MEVVSPLQQDFVLLVPPNMTFFGFERFSQNFL